MIRIVVETCDANMAAHVGGSVHRYVQTFDIEDSALEAYLRQRMDNCSHRQVVGVEIMPEETPHD